MEVFGHFLNKRVGFDSGEIEDGESVDPVVNGRGKEDSFVVEVLLDFVEVVLGTGANCCGHKSEFL